ncbi:DUF1801 domain-containing protein [Pseudoxanthomonas suwonensis]|uniref:YdhG-like domain-containing protein n=1 Tax=Pseudoxanthomonas suwonensis TaxID=314722 RepID=A0A0E3UMI7_9GAMM|nr:DUF1801 domain-containing protein [Pseudoxanthomonas suwonensis]AKC86376.1 hypothetical protein WQ53_05910 [Pseudoxanthomonas suwonensis]
MSQQELDAWFAAVPVAQQSTLSALRELVKSLQSDVVEEFKWSRPCYSTARGLFCYLQSTRSHATLGFYHGASLVDPEDLLEGTGKEMRHVKVRDAAACASPAIKALLQQAASQ